ncbi:SH3 domain-binding protein 4 [Platysternon megacephalum]|uniref:SH3 domain-binding protein 4 n=1 Tax=Platysternon megacephalum TaxID=55544 RepID=A0A4D9DSV0_9SAUR|nr:SH3 domain-binding protein 4 [Platysternon megacephalum]
MEGYPRLVAEMDPNPNHRPERQIPMVNRLTGEFSAPAPQGIFPKVWDCSGLGGGPGIGTEISAFNSGSSSAGQISQRRGQDLPLRTAPSLFAHSQRQGAPPKWLTLGSPRWGVRGRAGWDCQAPGAALISYKESRCLTHSLQQES